MRFFLYAFTIKNPVGFTSQGSSHPITTVQLLTAIYVILVDSGVMEDQPSMTTKTTHKVVYQEQVILKVRDGQGNDFKKEDLYNISKF